jgi:hypothetical protein
VKLKNELTASRPIFEIHLFLFVNVYLTCHVRTTSA